MKYMIAELMFVVKSAWHERGMICLLMSDKKEIRFPVEVNAKLKNVAMEQDFIGRIWMKTFQ